MIQEDDRVPDNGSGLRIGLEFKIGRKSDIYIIQTAEGLRIHAIDFGATHCEFLITHVI